MKCNRIIQVVGAHCCGEVGNVVTGGLIDVPGQTMWDKQQYIQNSMDHLRTLLLYEPRGGPNHAVNFLLPTNNSSADIGYVIAEVSKYPNMSGSNTICVATVILETGIIPMHEPITEFTMESPGGLVKVKCNCEDGKVLQVEIRNVPCFAIHSDAVIEVEGVGSVTVDTAYGGLMCAIVDAKNLGFSLTQDEAYDLGAMGQKIRTACNDQLQVWHPEYPNVNSVVNVVFAGKPKFETKENKIVAKSATMCNRGRLDRSPCGTGTSAWLASMAHKHQINLGEVFENFSLIGTKFIASIVGKTRVGEIEAIIPSIAGRAWITGTMQYSTDPSDPFPEGNATLTDLWR